MHVEKGFYYHYKRSPEDAFNYAAYEVLGTAFSTESGGVHSEAVEDFLVDEVVVYRPLFKEALVYKAGRGFWIRPIQMFLEPVTKEGKTFPRFQKITNPELIEKLAIIRDTLYSSE